MPKAYWIVRVSVRQPERYPDYLTAARPAFEKFGAKFIVRGGQFELMEGDARERNDEASRRERAEHECAAHPGEVRRETRAQTAFTVEPSDPVLQPPYARRRAPQRNAEP